VAEDPGARAAGLLLDEADSAHAAGRYQQALAAAGRAAEAAAQLDDLVLLVRALYWEASALRMLGDAAAALVRLTRILALAEDPAGSGRLDDPLAAQAVFRAYCGWVASARSLTGIPVRDLFGVLDAAERWLAVTGHRDWRAAILSERGMVHDHLGEREAAVAAAQEALAIAEQHPSAPGYTLGTYRFQLGHVLCAAGRPAAAVPLYQAILADPGARSPERRVAHRGLAECGLATGDLAMARREARRAVDLAEPLGDEALCGSLDTLAQACRSGGDLDAAWQAAGRAREAAARIGGHHRPYFAARRAADIALDRADVAAARSLLAELDRHAGALDATAGSDIYTRETAHRRRRLAGLTSGPGPGRCRSGPATSFARPGPGRPAPPSRPPPARSP
jgi:tetratricopeptide (TPR) repeat protein